MQYATKVDHKTIKDMKENKTFETRFMETIE